MALAFLSGGEGGGLRQPGHHGVRGQGKEEEEGGRGDVPSRVDTAGLRLVQPGHLAALVKAHNHGADAERPHTAALRVPLLHAGDELGDVLDGAGVLDRQAVRLGLEPRLVDQDPGVGVEAGKGQAYVRVDEADLGGRDARVLELHGRPLLAAQDHNVAALDAHGAGSCPPRLSV